MGVLRHAIQKPVPHATNFLIRVLIFPKISVERGALCAAMFQNGQTDANEMPSNPT
jgi:hypothetical protein